MAVIYRAYDEQCGRCCAVKLLKKESALREAIVVRFCDEARIMAQLCHPNIVKLYDAGQDPDGTLYLVMEMLEGQDLASYLQTTPRLPIESTLALIGEIGSALHTVHLSGMIHRDVKPQNIFLVQPPTDPADRCQPWKVKLIDFGLSKLCNASIHSRGSTQLFIGTPAYLPPEAWHSGSGALDARADQWSLAVLAFRLLSGRLPFSAWPGPLDKLRQQIEHAPPPPLGELVPSLGPHIGVAIQQALAKKREERFPNIVDFVSALQQLPRAADLCLPQKYIAGPEKSQSVAPAARAVTAAPSSTNEPTEAFMGAPVPALLLQAEQTTRITGSQRLWRAQLALGLVSLLALGSGVCWLGNWAAKLEPAHSPPSRASVRAVPDPAVPPPAAPLFPGIPKLILGDGPSDGPEPPPAPLVSPEEPAAELCCAAVSTPEKAPPRRAHRRHRPVPPQSPAELLLPTPSL